MLDILFISYDEPNADENYARIVSRFPHARRVHGVKGIANAHIAAAKKSLTRFFYVVDADAVIRDDFDFSYKPQIGDEEFVHIWYAANPIGLVYGYGGIKLFSKKFFKDVKSQLDFSTSLTKDIKIHEEIACDTIFNSDPVRAYRGAFREAYKLKLTIRDDEVPPNIREEAAQRLEHWMNPVACAFRDEIVLGVKKALETDAVDLMNFNSHKLSS